MSFVTRQVAHCDICGHEWLTKIVPKWCAKCKGRKWNEGQDREYERMVSQNEAHNAKLPLKDPKRICIPHRKDCDCVACVAVDKHFATVGHNPDTCRIYKCGMCAAMKKD